MNHNRKPLASNIRKKMEKEVKKGQALLQAPQELKSDRITPEQLLKKYPQKIQKHELSVLKNLKKKMHPKRKKNPSKRTTPGEVQTRDAAPRGVHIEGAHWEKTLNLQNVSHRKELKAKLLRRQSKK